MTWEQVNEAAKVNHCCIAEGKPNNLRAIQTWDRYHSADTVLYYLLRKMQYTSELAGYVRLLQVSSHTAVPKTWIVDYCSPSSYEAVLLAAREVEGTVLVKQFAVTDDLIAAHWPRITLTFPRLGRFPYAIVSTTENRWLVVLT